MKKMIDTLKNQKRDWEYRKNLAELETKAIKYLSEDNEGVSDVSRFISKDVLVRTTAFNQDTVKNAYKTLDNHLFLMNNLDLIHFKNKIDWDYEHTSSANTYSLYMQCLNAMSLLCDAYHETDEKLFLYKAYEILLDWYSFMKTRETYNKYVWVDHTAANRVLNIIYFYFSSNDVIELEEKIIYDLLVEHGDFLMEDGNYTENNHGIMTDRSLIMLSVFLHKHSSAQEWFDKGKYRLKNAFYRDFSYQGVHLENSPAYHALTKRMFQKVVDFLGNFNLFLDPMIEAGIKRSDEYLKYIYRPNKKLPIIGDTQQSTSGSINKSFKSFFDPHAGISILQDKGQTAAQSTWLAFICGYSSKTHKHRDDLSTSLYYNGMDVLVDSGRYNYDKNNKIRQYLVSPEAHSTITVKDKDYSVTSADKNLDLIRMTGFYTNDTYDIVKGIHHAYKGVKLTRTVVLLKPDIVLYIDQVKSNQQEHFRQVFNLAPNVAVDRIDRKYAEAHTGKNDMRIKQFFPMDEGKLIEADMNEPRSIISERFGQITETNQIIYEKSASEAAFLTALTLGEATRELQNIVFDEQGRKLTVYKNNAQIPIFI